MPRRCGCVPSFPTLLTALYRLQHGLEPIDPDPTLGYAANYLYMMQRPRPDPEHARRGRAVPDLHHRPRLQRVDVHRPGHHLDRCRPRRRRWSGPSVRCRARCTAAHRAGPSTCSTPSAPPTTPTAWIRARRRARRPLHGLRPPGVQDRRPPLGAAARASPSASAAPQVEFADLVEQRRSTCWPSSSPGGSSTPTWSSTPGSSWTAAACPASMFTPTFASSRVIGWTRARPRAGGRQPAHPPERGVRGRHAARPRPRRVLSRPCPEERSVAGRRRVVSHLPATGTLTRAGVRAQPANFFRIG